MRIPLIAFLCLVVSPFALAGEPSAVESLMQKNGCFACHGVEQKIIGPAYKDVAKRYAGNPQAKDMLVLKVRQGGGGVWGSAGMPPQAHLKDSEIQSMVDWVLHR